MDDAKKIAILGKSLPKYLWMASCYIGDNLLFTFTFDATNVNNAMLGVNVISFVDETVKTTFIEFLTINKILLQELFAHMASVDFLINELT